MSDTYFWCAVTLVCVCVDALGVNWGLCSFCKEKVRTVFLIQCITDQGLVGLEQFSQRQHQCLHTRDLTVDVHGQVVLQGAEAGEGGEGAARRRGVVPPRPGAVRRRPQPRPAVPEPELDALLLTVRGRHVRVNCNETKDSGQSESYTSLWNVRRFSYW